MSLAKSSNFRWRLQFSRRAIPRQRHVHPEGRVKLSVLSQTGKEAVVGVLGAGDFFGEGCLAGQSLRMATATAMTAAQRRGRQEGRDGRAAARAAGVLRSVPLAHADAEHPHRGRPGRSALQLEREAAGARRCCCWRATANRTSRSTSLPKLSQETARRDGRHDALARQLLHEQVPQARVHRVQRRPQDQQLAPQLSSCTTDHSEGLRPSDSPDTLYLLAAASARSVRLVSTRVARSPRCLRGFAPEPRPDNPQKPTSDPTSVAPWQLRDWRLGFDRARFSERPAG